MNREDIDAARRTVIHVAAYFDELKQSAGGLAEVIDVSDRGFFTPDEEEQTLALLVSYWQARNALLDLITSYRSDEQLADRDRPSAFLVAFAAALVLIDAARFLRETVHHRAVVRRKLNDPAPEFGIPARVYDTVQKSLLSTRHAWHLYHAIKYYEQNEPQLRQLSDSDEWKEVLAIIDHLRHRLEVSVTTFARTKLRARASRAFRRAVRDTLAKALYGLQKLGSSMMADVFVRPGHKPQLPESIVRELHPMLSPGDVLVVRKEFALTNYFLPGYWPHAALYLGRADELAELRLLDFEHVKPRWSQLLDEASGGDSGEPRRVLESMKDGVRIRSLDSPFASDSVIVLRPNLSADDVAQGLARALAHEGKRYDFDFDFSRSDRLVCTEVVYRAYDGVGAIHFDLQRRAGRPTLAGADLIRKAIAAEHFQPVAAFVPQFSDSLLLGSQVTPVLRQAEADT